jgi:hypothetical protein
VLQPFVSDLEALVISSAVDVDRLRAALEAIRDYRPPPPERSETHYFQNKAIGMKRIAAEALKAEAQS